MGPHAPYGITRPGSYVTIVALHGDQAIARIHEEKGWATPNVTVTKNGYNSRFSISSSYFEKTYSKMEEFLCTV